MILSKTSELIGAVSSSQNCCPLYISHVFERQYIDKDLMGEPMIYNYFVVTFKPLFTEIFNAHDTILKLTNISWPVISLFVRIH